MYQDPRYWSKSQWTGAVRARNRKLYKSQSRKLDVLYEAVEPQYKQRQGPRLADVMQRILYGR